MEQFKCHSCEAIVKNARFRFCAKCRKKRDIQALHKWRDKLKSKNGEIGPCKCGQIVPLRIKEGRLMCQTCRNESTKKHHDFYRGRNLKFINKIKDESQCMDCGGKFHFTSMDFDHRESALKVMSVSSLVHLGRSIKTIKKEMAKCDIVCANCHRVRTWSRLNE
jgi:hypothetical protein